MLFPLFRGKIPSAAFFELACVVKLQVDIDIVRLRKYSWEWIENDLRASGRPYEEGK